MKSIALPDILSICSMKILLRHGARTVKQEGLCPSVFVFPGLAECPAQLDFHGTDGQNIHTQPLNSQLPHHPYPL